jgi:hypothetical protein
MMVLVAAAAAAAAAATAARALQTLFALLLYHRDITARQVRRAS